jgi:phenylacetate-CoA ligase
MMPPAFPDPSESADWSEEAAAHAPGTLPVPIRIWNPDVETIDRSRLRDFQLQALRETARRASVHVPIYQAKMKRARIRPDDIHTLEDVRQLPFTTKEDFMQAYPLGMLAVPLQDVVRIHGSSGTTYGKSTIVGYTRKDMESWTEMCARLVMAAGVTNNDVAQIAFGYGLFTGGFGLHQGLERVGATVIPLSSGQTDRQLQFLRDFQVTALICTPSYALFLAETVREKGLAPGQISLRWGLFGGEPWTHEARREIESGLGMIATDNYGLSELCGPGVSYECLERNGLHLSEDQFLVEVVDPATGEPVEEGEMGELVLTSLGREAVPLIRYRTRDLTRVTTAPCRCGRTLARMTKVLGRTDDMIIIRGVNVFPSQIESILLQVEHTAPHYQIVVNREGALDVMKIRVEVTEALFDDEMRRLRAVQEEIRERLRSTLGLKVDVELVEPRTLERFVGKAKRVVDLRTGK